MFLKSFYLGVIDSFYGDENKTAVLRKDSKGVQREKDKKKDKGKGNIMSTDMYYDEHFESYFIKGNNL